MSFGYNGFTTFQIQTINKKLHLKFQSNSFLISGYRVFWQAVVSYNVS